MALKNHMNQFHSPAVFNSTFFDTTGDGTGSIEANVDGSVTPVEFKITCPEGWIYELHRMIVFIRDTGKMTAGKYGVGIEMTNGITGFLDPAGGGDRIHLYTQHPIKANADWAAYCHDVNHFAMGVGDEIMTARYTYTNEGAPFSMRPGDAGGFIINDDLTGLVEHHFRAGQVKYKIQ